MANYIPVPRDLTRVKTKIIFNLTKRQILCVGAGFLFAVTVRKCVVCVSDHDDDYAAYVFPGNL